MYLFKMHFFQHVQPNRRQLFTMLKPDWLSTPAHMRQARPIGQIYVMLNGEPIKAKPCCHVQGGVILKLPVWLKKKIN